MPHYRYEGDHKGRPYDRDLGAHMPVGAGPCGCPKTRPIALKGLRLPLSVVRVQSWATTEGCPYGCPSRGMRVPRMRIHGRDARATLHVHGRDARAPWVVRFRVGAGPCACPETRRIAPKGLLLPLSVVRGRSRATTGGSPYGCPSRGMRVPRMRIHGRDARATLLVHGQDARATLFTGFGRNPSWSPTPRKKGDAFA